MTLSNEAYAMAVQIAQANMTVEEMADLVVKAIVERADQGKSFNPKPTVETVLTATRMINRRIVVEEWHRAVAEKSVQAEAMIGRILNRLDGVDPDQWTLPGLEPARDA